MTTILKRQIEGHLLRCRQWIDLSKEHPLPLNCLKMAEIQLEAVEILLNPKPVQTRVFFG